METIILILKNPVVLISFIIMILFKLFPPKNINSWYGYRTNNSKKTKSKWDFAQKYSATLSLKLLLPLLIIQILIYNFYGSTMVIDLSTTACWLFSLAIVISKTEKKLKEINN
ncbi:SdpI family protein [Flavobacterium sp. UBA7680]|uniref:SdpI family protein n=1 Tax=Flavobacterium sp. UBA7680 TaxID=1946559 RepID=UPI0025C4D9F1|nr:SdpI family protein [Flavobacterium sp. UBA7680]